MGDGTEYQVPEDLKAATARIKAQQERGCSGCAALRAEVARLTAERDRAERWLDEVLERGNRILGERNAARAALRADK